MPGCRRRIRIFGDARHRSEEAARRALRDETAIPQGPGRLRPMFSVEGAMNFVHIHLAINHSPLYATLFAFFLLLIGMIIRTRSIATAGLVIAIIAALGAIAADLTAARPAASLETGPPI